MQKEIHSAPKARTENIVVSELKNELLLYCLETHQAFCLNETAAAVYQTADGTKSTTEIADTLSKKFKLNVTEDFVLFSLDELKTKNLIEFSAFNQTKSILPSRRDLIKKVALSTAAALPVITMLTAPTAAAAQSPTACIADGDTCTPSGNFPFTQDGCCAGLVCCGNGSCGSTCPV